MWCGVSHEHKHELTRVFRRGAVEPAAKSGAKSPVQPGVHADQHGYAPSHRHGDGHEDGFAKSPVSTGFFRNADRHSQPSQGPASPDRLLANCRGHHPHLRLQATEGAVRGALERLGARGFLVRSRAAAGRAQGNRYAFSADPCPHIMPPDFTESGMEASMEPDAPSNQKGTSSFLTEETDRKNLSVFSGEKDSRNVILQLESLTEEDISFHWPNLAKAGFGTCQLRQILARLSQVGIGAENLAQGLTYAEWELEHGTMRDKNGESVTHPLNWVFSSLARTGYYRRPQGYISPQEQAEIDAAEEDERLKKARDARKKSAFEAWCAGLSPEEKNAIVAPGNRAFPMPEDTVLRQHFFHKVWPDILKQSPYPDAEKQGQNMTPSQEAS